MQMFIKKIIKDYLISPHITDDLELLQDRAPAHRAIATIEYFEQEELTYRQNPSKSPDFNPIEKVWGWMKKVIDQRNPQTKEDLILLLKETWDAIPQDTIQEFITHNKTVVKDIIESGGGMIVESNRHHK